MSAMGGFLAGLTTGYGTVSRFKRDREEAQARAEDRAFQKEERERLRTERAKEDDYKDGLKRAAAPVEVQGETYQPAVDDDGNAMPANPTAGTFAANGVRFQSRTEAEKAAADANTPQAVAQRVSSYMRGQGRIEDASRIETLDTQRRAADVQVGEAEVQSKNRNFARAAAEAAMGGPEQLAQFATTQYNDGFTYKAVPGEKGGFTMARFDADGNQTGQRAFKSPEDFLQTAMARVDPTRYVEQRINQRNRDEEYADRRKDREDDVAFRDSQARHTQAYQNSYLGLLRDRANNAGAGRGGAGGRGGAAGEGERPMPSFDPKSVTEFAEKRAGAENDGRIAAGQPPMTGREIQDRITDIVRERRKDFQQELAVTGLLNAVDAAGDDPKALTAAWQAASKVPGGLQILAQAGYKPPPGIELPKPAPVPAAPAPKPGFLDRARGILSEPPAPPNAAAAPTPAAMAQRGAPVAPRPLAQLLQGQGSQVQAVERSGQAVQLQQENLRKLIQQGAGQDQIQQAAQALQITRDSFNRTLGQINPQLHGPIRQALGL